MADQSVLEEIARSWTRAQPLVAAFISVAVTDFHDAQDVLQEVAAAVISGTRRPDFSIVSFNGWVLGIARNKIADHFGKSGRSLILLDGEILDQLAAAYADSSHDWSRQIDAMGRCIQSMRGPARQILELRYKSGLSSEAIAGQLGRSPSAIRMTLMRLRITLRECIENRLAAGGAT